MSEHMLPGQAKPKLIVVLAFDRADDGELFPAYGPADQQSEERADRTAKALAGKHTGVIAWSRDADPALGDYGAPATLFMSGDVPDIE
jgi:hypothetical protein